MSTKKPIVGLIFLIGLALITAGAGYYTFFLPKKTACPAIAETYTVNVTIHQWYFEINGTDATHNGGWSICHGSTVTFVLTSTFEHDNDIGKNYTQHGFFISGVMSSPLVVTLGDVVRTPPLTFNVPAGDLTLVCTIDCGFLPGVGGHPISTTIHVV